MRARRVAQRVALPLEHIPILAGILLSWSLAAPPGPANALMAHVAAQRSFGAGWLTGLGAVTGDVLMFTLMWLGVLRLVDGAPALKVAMGAVGALLMAYFAWEALRTARRLARARGAPMAEAQDRAADVTAWGGFGRSFVAVTTSPFNWAWWLTFGAAMFARLGLGVVFGFFAGLVAWCAFWSALARVGATRVRRFGEGVAVASAIVLLVFAVVVAVFAAQTARTL